MLGLGLSLWNAALQRSISSPANYELREDGTHELREDGSYEMRE